ncbi:hypothetical protein [Williamsia sp.]|uniref:hypothetical protein n=1 Tax=Williamsia sp. TaxID=1872085 RepID=UPI002F93323F
MGDEVKFTDEQWEKVAQAAETFAATLKAEAVNLQDVVTTNWAGQCAEGEGIIDNLKDLVRGTDGSFSAAVGSEVSYLESLASQCRKSKSSLNLADLEGGANFER